MNRNEAVCSSPATAVFFARCPPLVTEAEIQSVFSEYGEVVDVNLFRRWPAAKVSKGCGIVQFTSHAAAQAALEALNGKHMFKDSEAPMVVEWVDVRMLSTRPPGGSRRSLPPRSHAAALHSTSSNNLGSSTGFSTQHQPHQYHPSLQSTAVMRPMPMVSGAHPQVPTPVAQQQQANQFALQLSRNNSSSSGGGGAYAVIDDATHWMTSLDPCAAGQAPLHMLPMVSQMQGLVLGGTVSGSGGAGACSIAPFGGAGPSMLPTQPIQQQQMPVGMMQQTQPSNLGNIYTDSNLAQSWTVQNLPSGTGMSNVALMNGSGTHLMDASMASNISGSQLVMNSSGAVHGLASVACGTGGMGQGNNSSSMSGHSQVLFSGGASSSSGALGARYVGEFSGPLHNAGVNNNNRVAPAAAVGQVVNMPQMQQQQVIGAVGLNPAAAATGVLPSPEMLNSGVAPAAAVTPVLAAGAPVYNTQGVPGGQQGLMEVTVPVTPAEAPAVTGRLEAVMELSGAGVSFNANPQGLSVKITGSAAQVQTACQLLGCVKSC